MNMAIQKNDVRLEDPEKKIYWGGIIAGTFIAVTIGSLLSLLGIGIGASIFTLNDTTVGEITIKSGIWFILSGVISMYCGGWVAGRFSHIKKSTHGYIQGFLTYCIATLFSFLALTTVLAFLMNGAFSVLEHNLYAASSALERFENSNEGLSNVAPQTTRMLEELVPTEAQDKTSQKPRPMTGQEKEIAENAVNTLGQAALINFFILFAGAVAAGIGGAQGVKSNRIKL